MPFQDHPVRTAVLLLLALGALFIVLAPLFPHLGYVRELTVGGGVLTDTDKLRDMRLVPMAIVYQLALILALTMAGLNLNQMASLGVLAIAAGATAAAWTNASWGELSCFAALAIAGAAAHRACPEEWQNASGHMLISAVGLTLIAARLIEVGPVISLCGSLFIISGLSLLRMRSLLVLLSFSGTIAIAGTMVLSMPFLWIAHAGTRPSFIDGAQLLLAMAALYSGSVAAWSAWTGGRFTLPIAATAIAILALVAPYVPPPSLPADDSHFGERLLAAQALASGGSWFTSFFSPHGLSDAGGAAAAWLLGDFTASGIAAGHALWLWYPTAILAWLLVRRIGALPAAAILISLPINDSTILLLALNLVIATEAMVLRPSFLGGALGAAIAFAGLFLNAGLGAASAIVTGLAGLTIQGRYGLRHLFAFLVGGIVMALALTALFFREVAGQLHFLAVSAGTNLTIYGNGQTSTIYYELPHFLFAVGPLMAIVLASGRLPVRVNSLGGLAGLMVLVIPFAVYAIVMNSYAAARLDGTAPRALIVSYGILVLLPLYLSLLCPDRKALRASVLCAALIAGIGEATPNLRDGKPLLPPRPLSGSVPIALDIPSLGTGSAAPEQLSTIREVKRVVDALLSPEETFINLTNRNALYFYLDRDNPVPIASTYNAAPEAFQTEFLDAIRKDMPPLALVSIENIEHDGLSLPLRSHRIYDFVLEHYQPFKQGPYTYAIRKDLTERLGRLPPDNQEFQFSIGDYTDQYWQSGVAVGENALRWSFALPPLLKNKIRDGDELRFSDGVNRKVLKAEGANVLTQPPLVLSPDGSPPATQFSIVNREILHGSPWEGVFHQAQLSRIPSAWGRSIDNLADQINHSNVTLKLLNMSQVEHDSDGGTTYRITGGDPTWVFAPSRWLMPSDAGLMALDIRCLGSKTNPLVQVFWRSSAGQFSEDASLLFDASFERNLVPLDSTPFWSLLPEIAEIRVDVANPKACQQVELKGLTLLYRRPTK